MKKNLSKEDMRQIRESMISQYGETYEVVNTLFFEVDPFDLNYGNNVDEYECEVWEVLPQLVENLTEDDLLKILESACRRSFGKQTVKEGFPKLKVLASKIKEILQL